jgi:hypothetical protein
MSKKASKAAFEVSRGNGRDTEMGRWRPKKADMFTSAIHQLADHTLIL